MLAHISVDLAQLGEMFNVAAIDRTHPVRQANTTSFLEIAGESLQARDGMSCDWHDPIPMQRKCAHLLVASDETGSKGVNANTAASPGLIARAPAGEF
jgi:hypothetical protein